MGATLGPLLPLARFWHAGGPAAQSHPHQHCAPWVDTRSSHRNPTLAYNESKAVACGPAHRGPTPLPTGTHRNRDRSRDRCSTPKHPPAMLRPPPPIGPPDSADWNENLVSFNSGTLLSEVLSYLTHHQLGPSLVLASQDGHSSLPPAFRSTAGIQLRGCSVQICSKVASHFPVGGIRPDACS